MKGMTKAVICAAGLSLMITGCAYFRSPDQDPAHMEKERLDAEGPISPRSQWTADMVSNVWMAGWTR
jgi:hypothetical protein